MEPGIYYLRSLTVLINNEETNISFTNGYISVAESHNGLKSWHVSLNGFKSYPDVFDDLFESGNYFVLRALTDDGLTLRGKAFVKELNVDPNGSETLLTGTGPLTEL
ncbi:hypothetical protein [Thermoactinomyces daqus]|uniref:hypothetical protein n=1 Tax=Thermoactinomyces daqus TaxID=1329516 RepID=UPI00051A4604|nr:hypothetical protein [Thermoactinomyces daqus]